MRTYTNLPTFDTLVAFYKKNPEAYDIFRKKILEDEVAAAPPQHRAALRNTLLKIELAHKNANTPLEAAINACLLMFESAIQLHMEITNLQERSSNLQASLIIEKARKKSLNQNNHF